jgi:hypothetical protein
LEKMKKFILLIVLYAVFCTADYAEAENRPVICTENKVAGHTLASIVGQTVDGSECGRTKYARPTATDLVRKGLVWQGSTPFVWQTFGSLAPTDTLDTCSTESVPDGYSPTEPWSAAADACKSWSVVAKSTIIPAAPPVNVTGKFRLSWEPLDEASGTAATGYKLYSSAAGGTPSLLATTTAAARYYDVTGYQSGFYQFCGSVVYAEGESEKLCTPTIEIKVSAKSPLKSFGITSVTIE